MAIEEDWVGFMPDLFRLPCLVSTQWEKRLRS